MGSDGRAGRPRLPLPSPTKQASINNWSWLQEKVPLAPGPSPRGCWETERTFTPGPCSSEGSTPQTQGGELSIRRRGLQSYQQSRLRLTGPPEHSTVTGLKNVSPLTPQPFPLKAHPHGALIHTNSLTHSVKNELWLMPPDFEARSLGKCISVLCLFPPVSVMTNDEF